MLLSHGLNQFINILQLEWCLSALNTWFSLNGLALNPSKSEVILMGTKQRSASLPYLSNISVADSTVLSTGQATRRHPGQQPFP